MTRIDDEAPALALVDRAVQELTAHKAALEAVSAALLDQGSLDREQLIELMNRSAN